jgi:hypothetical protein
MALPLPLLLVLPVLQLMATTMQPHLLPPMMPLLAPWCPLGPLLRRLQRLLQHQPLRLLWPLHLWSRVAPWVWTATWLPPWRCEL